MIKNLFTLSGACLTVAAFLQISPLQAQNKTADGMVSDDRVVAIVKGSKVLFRDVRLAHENLPQQYRGMPLAQLYQPLVLQLVERRLVLLAAEAEKLADKPEVASRIAMAREYFNDQVVWHNIRIQQIPDGLMAWLAGLRLRGPFIASDLDRAEVRVKLHEI